MSVLGLIIVGVAAYVVAQIAEFFAVLSAECGHGLIGCMFLLVVAASYVLIIYLAIKLLMIIF